MHDSPCRPERGPRHICDDVGTTGRGDGLGKSVQRFGNLLEAEINCTDKPCNSKSEFSHSETVFCNDRAGQLSRQQ